MISDGDDITRAWGPFGFRTSRWQPWLTRFAAEFVGTFFVAFVGAFLRALVGSATTTVPLLPPPFDTIEAQIDNNFEIIGLLVTSTTIGFANFAITLALGNLSGAHCNPSISLMMWLLAWGEGSLELIGVTFGVTVLYVGAQLGGAALAGWVLYGLIAAFGPIIVPTPVPPFNEFRALVMEFIGALFFLFVLLTTSSYAVNHRGAPYRTNPWHPLSVGLASATTSMLSARVSFGVINPASHFASAVAGGFPASSWVYYVAPFSAAIFAALGYRLLFSMYSPLVGEANRAAIHETTLHGGDSKKISAMPPPSSGVYYRYFNRSSDLS